MNRSARTSSGMTAAAVLLVALLVSACGVRGPLEPPAQAKAEGEAKSAEAGSAGENSAAKPKPHEPFVLDGLLR
ncbi:MAG: lipoprotein [Hyphomicrobium sp.]